MSMTRTELRDAARKAFGEGTSMPGAAESWQQLAELGWFMMTVPEEQGGLGLGGDAVCAIHYELGRALVPGAAIAQMAAIEALCALDSCGDLLAAAMGGERIGLSLDPVGDPRSCVPDGDLAGQLLIVTPERIALAPIAGANQRATWDESRRLFDVVTGTETVLAAGPSALAITERVQSLMLRALAADSLGAAQAVLDMTIEYLKTRRQFDRPLALFQALKHRIADMKQWHAAADALLWSSCDGAAALAGLGALKAHATTAACRIAEEAIQLHGGIGLTAEHPAHWYFKRVFLNSALGGSADHWNEAAGRAALDAAA